jgi:type III pantothenate kinase
MFSVCSGRGRSSRLRGLIINVGNSTVTVAVWQGTGQRDELERRLEIPTPGDARARSDLSARLDVLAAAAGSEVLVLVSVVPVMDAVIGATDLAVVRIDHTLDLPFRLGVSDPAAVGADRYCNVAAAVAAGWQDALIVDAGTATTFDLLQDGEFAGGLIAPGMAFAARKLGETAARLAPVPFAPCPLEVGRDTASAMQTGAFHVGVGGVVATVAGLLERYGDRPVVITGGLAAHLRRPGWRHDVDWTLRGAAFLARLNAR